MTAFIFAGALTALGAQSNDGAPDGYVSFCEIAQNPQRFDQKIVLTAGIEMVGPEVGLFFDPACRPSEGRDVATGLVAASDAVWRSAGWRRMQTILDRRKRSFVVVRAVFDAYQRYEGKLPDDPKLREMVLEGSKRFGHLNTLRFRLRVQEVILALEVAE